MWKMLLYIKMELKGNNKKKDDEISVGSGKSTGG